MKITENKRFIGLASVFLLLAVFAVVSSPFSAVFGETNQMNFYNINEEFPADSGYDGYDPREDYEAFNNEVQIGEYEVHLSDFGSSGEACSMDVEIREDGSQVDSFEVVDAHSLADYSDDKNTGWHEYGDLEVRFGNPTYSDAHVWDGIVWSMDCGGMFNRYNYDIDWDEFDLDVQVEEHDEHITVGFIGQNNWETVNIELDTEVCVADGFCNEKTLEEQAAPEGDFVYTQEFNRVEDYDINVEGEVKLDLDSFSVSGVENSEGHVNDQDSIKIADIEADEDITVVSEFEPPEEDGGTENPENVDETEPPEDEDLDREPEGIRAVFWNFVSFLL